MRLGSDRPLASSACANAVRTCAGHVRDVQECRGRRSSPGAGAFASARKPRADAAFA